MTRREVIESWIGKTVPEMPVRGKDGYYDVLGTRMISVTTAIDRSGSDMSSAAAQRAVLANEVVRLAESARARQTVETWVKHTEGYRAFYVKDDVSPVSLLRDRDYLTGHPLAVLRQAADRGTLLHHAHAVHAKGLPVTWQDAEEWTHETVINMGFTCKVEDAYPYVRSLWAFLDERSPDIRCVETFVFDPFLGYAGYLDTRWLVSRNLFSIDIKTSEALTRDMVAQLSGYHYAPLCVDSSLTVVRNVRPNKAAIVKVSPTHVMFRPISSLPEGRRAFYHMLRVAEFKAKGALPDRTVHPLSIKSDKMTELTTEL